MADDGGKIVSVEDFSGSAPEFSDEALALLFAAKFEDRLRYTAAWNQWSEWSGACWKPEKTLHAYDLVRAVCREVAAVAERGGKHKIADEIASGRTVAAVEKLVRSDRRLAATSDQWDRDPLLLCTPKCTVDLRSGAMRENRPSDYMTRSTAASPSTDFGQPQRWQNFLAQVTGGDKELELFLWRMAGYALTGLTREHAIFFLYGRGSNGKSVFLSTLAGLLGQYARSAPVETFTASHVDRHPTELAALRGARLVTATETEEGRRWAESKLKMLTGGDTIAARFMRGDFFEYTPQFKLIIAGNHRPAIRGVDEAMRRRMNLVPFAVTIPEGERDEQLADHLREEWPAILQWAIDGCREWDVEGLAQPEAVWKATADYLAAEDAPAQWIAERCEIKPGWWCSSADLFADWRRWADAAGEFVGSRKRFCQALEDRGFKNERGGHERARGFNGLKLIGLFNE